MGAGIAYVSAVEAGIPTTLVDNNSEALVLAENLIEKLLAKELERENITAEEVQTHRALIKTSSDLAASVKNTDFVIEAVPENLDLKLKIFGQLADLAPKNAILATNTSSLSITRIASGAKKAADRVVGVHFFIPVPKMPGVEIIRGLLTSDSTHEAAIEVVNRMNKMPSTVIDSPGFIVNRILAPYLGEAIYCLETGLASAEDIDNIMMTACGMPVGPLRLADFIGLDTIAAVNGIIRDDTGESRYRKSVLVKKLIDSGHLGVKTGRGFYDYRSKL